MNRYESENADHVKITTTINHLKGPINQNLMLKVTNTTTFNEVHGWISNYFNKDATSAVGGINEQSPHKDEKNQMESLMDNVQVQPWWQYEDDVSKYNVKDIN
eukprot:2935516-Amphidinium_carterae.1